MSDIVTLPSVAPNRLRIAFSGCWQIATGAGGIIRNVMCDPFAAERKVFWAAEKATERGLGKAQE